MADGHRVMCGSIVLNNSPDRMQHRIADSVYNNCREGKMSLPSFPDFTPVLGALRDNVPGGSTVEYKVCVCFNRMPENGWNMKVARINARSSLSNTTPPSTKMVILLRMMRGPFLSGNPFHSSKNNCSKK